VIQIGVNQVRTGVVDVYFQIESAKVRKREEQAATGWRPEEKQEKGVASLLDSSSSHSPSQHASLKYLTDLIIQFSTPTS
jgi:hypothetical protein